MGGASDTASIEELMEQSKEWFRYDNTPRAPIDGQLTWLYIHPLDPRCFMCAGTGLTLRTKGGALTPRPIREGSPHETEFYQSCRDAPCPYCYQGVHTYGVFPDPYADLDRGRPKPP